MSVAGVNRCLFPLGDTVGSVGLASLTSSHYTSERTAPFFLYRMEYDKTYDIRFLTTNNSRILLADRLRHINAGTAIGVNASTIDVSVSQFFRCVLSKHYTVGQVIPALLSPQGNATR